MGSRVSVIESRHVDLGAGLADWNDMAVAWTYATTNDEEHAAVREAAGLIDLSGLRKIHVTGNDAEAAMNYLLPRDVTKVEVGRSIYTTLLNDEGGIDDDAIVYRLAAKHFLIVFGTGDTVKQLEKACAGRDARYELDDDMHCLSLQGPLAMDFLNAHTPIDLSAMKYFAQQETTLFGHKVILARTGYSGERGYDIFVHSESACDVWDEILNQGQSQGIRPFSFVCLNTIRIEAGLLFYPFDMSAEQTPEEAGLGWTVAKDKAADYIGKAAVLARLGKEKSKFVGIVANHTAAVGEPIAGGEKVIHGNKEVGKITASLYSNRLQQSVAFAQIDPSVAVGSDITVQGAEQQFSGKVTTLPFYDPEKLKPRGL